MNYRVLSIAFLCATTAAQAFASFDLMLLPNLSGRINRYDPENNIQLGSFSAGATIRQVTINQAAGVAYVYDTTFGRMRMIDYNTGSILNNLALSGGPTSMEFESVSNRLFFTTNSGIAYFNSALSVGVSLTSTLTGITWSSSYSRAGTVTFVGINASNNIVFDSFNATTGVSIGTNVTATAVLPGTRLGKAAGFLASAGNDYGAFTYVATDGSLRIFRSFNFSSGVGTVSNQVLAAQFSIANVMPAAVTNHSGFYLAGQDFTTATLTRVTQFDSQGAFAQLQTNTFTGATFSTGGYQVANVVAPEPASMLAMGLGLAALAKKRTKKS